jgi:hypothetical protein
VPFEGSYGFGRDRITTGWQRISLRSIDEAPPTFDQPRPQQPCQRSMATQALTRGRSRVEYAAPR